MRAACLVACLALSAFASAQSARAHAGAVGERAPNFSLESPNGSLIILSRFNDRPVFINFFASWCAPCRQELPAITDRYGRYGSRVMFIGVDEQETAQVVKTFTARSAIRFPVGIDSGAVGARYGVGALPQSVFLDRHGIVRLVWHGSMTPRALQRGLSLIDAP